MEYHERELLVYRIRLGVIKVNNFEIHPPTVEDKLESCSVYHDAYYKALDQEVMTETQMNEWMIKRDLWSYHEDKELETIRTEIENLKVDIFKSSAEKKKASGIRFSIRKQEEKLKQKINKKYLYYHNTCESIASLEKLRFLIRRNCVHNNKIYNISDEELDFALDIYRENTYEDSLIREICRNEPWRSLWFTKDHLTEKLFLQINRDITVNQQNLITWSKTYDNIHESIDCPSEDVINDDDMLDGWFIFQGRKRKQERKEKEFDNKISDKIKNSEEVFLMASDQEEAQDIDNMNSYHAKMIKKQRAAVIKKGGGASQYDFEDVKLDKSSQQNQGFLKNARRR